MEKVDLDQWRAEARLFLIREAAGVQPPDLNGRTIAEALHGAMPAWTETPPEERYRLARKAAEVVLPGGLWLADVVAATWELWASPSCPRRARFSKLAMPTRATVPASVDARPTDPRQHAEWERLNEEAHEKAHEKKSRPAPAPAAPHHGNTGKLWPPTRRDAAVVARYQWGSVSRRRLAKEHGISPERVTAILRSWSERLPLCQRSPLPAGRPSGK